MIDARSLAAQSTEAITASAEDVDPLSSVAPASKCAGDQKCCAWCGPGKLIAPGGKPGDRSGMGTVAHRNAGYRIERLANPAGKHTMRGIDRCIDNRNCNACTGACLMNL